jgi:hypothetical protein
VNLGRELVVIKEFRDFAMRGNVVDMAVGIIVGVGLSSGSYSGAPVRRAAARTPSRMRTRD